VSREVATDLAMLDRLARPAGKDVVDIGCGGGALVRELTANGARVVGVEVSEDQLAAAVSRDPGDGACYLVGRAERLPIDDASVDLAVFMRSLHHVPASELTRALGEARRVIRPDGIVYVVEPLAEGHYFELVSLVEDELEARSAAQRALALATRAALHRERTVEYDVSMRIADLDTLRARIVSVDPERAERFEARRAELAEAFERLGEAGEAPGERRFLQPMRADVLLPASPWLRRGAASF
jgi:SAM-dependent methyltransferase